MATSIKQGFEQTAAVIQEALTKLKEEREELQRNIQFTETAIRALEGGGFKKLPNKDEVTRGPASKKGRRAIGESAKARWAKAKRLGLDLKGLKAYEEKKARERQAKRLAKAAAKKADE